MGMGLIGGIATSSITPYGETARFAPPGKAG
jgi:hypothetical protein